jgi:hypothetical protein
VGVSPYVMTYEGRFAFPVTPREMWSVMAQSEQFAGWWAWLSDVRADGPALRDGSSLHGVVAPPLPYRMHLDIALDRCVDARSIDASVRGDLVGPAHLVLEPDGVGTRATARWSVEMMQPSMRVAARVAPRLLRWGHDRVVDAAVAGLRRRHVAVAARPTGS